MHRQCWRSQLLWQVLKLECSTQPVHQLWPEITQFTKALTQLGQSKSCQASYGRRYCMNNLLQMEALLQTGSKAVPPPDLKHHFTYLIQSHLLRLHKVDDPTRSAHHDLASIAQPGI